MFVLCEYSIKCYRTGIFSIRHWVEINIPKYTAFSLGRSLAWPSHLPHTQVEAQNPLSLMPACCVGLQWA